MSYAMVSSLWNVVSRAHHGAVARALLPGPLHPRARRRGAACALRRPGAPRHGPGRGAPEQPRTIPLGEFAKPSFWHFQTRSRVHHRLHGRIAGGEELAATDGYEDVYGVWRDDRVHLDLLPEDGG